jgi:hypothetical protein
MGHPRRYFPAGTPYFITNRLSEGLPFVANLYINLMLFGILARACFRFRAITVCAFLFLSNHYHMIVVLRGDGSQLAGFMHYVDGEIAKLVVRWLGRRNVKVWGQRYHAAPLLTAESVFQELVYTFSNPLKANLVARASEWDGCSSYSAFEDPTPKTYKWIRPSKAPLLPNSLFHKRIVRRLVEKLLETEAPSYTLNIEPFAWMACFPEMQTMSTASMKQRLYEALAKEEKRAEHTRKQEKRTVVGAAALAEQNPHKPYKPKKFGKRVWCISTCPELRKAFIELYAELCQLADEAYKKALGTFEHVRVPLGMFAPPRRPTGSILPLTAFY